MFHYTIKEYLAILIPLLIVYYAYVGIRYFRPELKSLFMRRDHPDNFLPEEEEKIINPFTNHFREPVEVDDNDERFMQAEDLVGRLKGVIAHSSFSNQDKSGLLAEIRELFGEYSLIDTPVLKHGITTMIITECKNIGAVTLTSNEVDKLWGTEAG